MEDDVDGRQRAHDNLGLEHQVWRRQRGTLARLTARSVVLSTETTPAPFRVSGIAFAVWLLLDDEPTTGELVQRVAESFGMSASAVEPTVLSGLNGLVDLGAVAPQ
jgi:hypothetical protein